MRTRIDWGMVTFVSAMLLAFAAVVYLDIKTPRHPERWPLLSTHGCCSYYCPPGVPITAPMIQCAEFDHGSGIRPPAAVIVQVPGEGTARAEAGGGER